MAVQLGDCIVFGRLQASAVVDIHCPEDEIKTFMWYQERAELTQHRQMRLKELLENAI